MILIDDIKKKIEEIGYYATEELLFDTFNALYIFNEGIVNPGQDIYAICLEGPPGAGKTEFAKTYTKLSSKILGEEVIMVDYQCDITTGKAELFEDINISAAIRRDADKVNIPGKLIEAIKSVNSGKRVVLFIDEYDKAREETDAFFLQLLQSGKINSTQHGDLEIKEEYKGNIQVILCKNDMREELSGPLSRRLRYLRLDYMEPTIFYKIAKRTLIDEREDKINDGLLNLVSLMYQRAYKNRELYDRLPSCSEMLIALSDADRLIKKANAPQYIVYKTLIKNMFKSEDDIKTFESSLNHLKSEEDSKLSAMISAMKIGKEDFNTVDLNELIASKVFTEAEKKLTEKTEELQNLINEYKNKFEEMEQKRKSVIEEEIRKIMLQSGKLVTTTVPKTNYLFEDESAYIKRGYNIFETSKDDWTEIGSISYEYLSQHSLVNKMTELASKLGIVIYENGVMLKEDGDLKLILISSTDENGKIIYKFMASQPIIPSTYLIDINNFINFANSVLDEQPKKSNTSSDTTNNIQKGSYILNTLVYNDEKISYPLASDNVYAIELSDGVKSTKLSDLCQIVSCVDNNNAILESKKIMRRVLKNE